MLETIDASHLIIFSISIIIQFFAAVLGAYYIGISLFAWLPRKEYPSLTNKTHTFALLVAAHNEEEVIAYIVDSLKKLNYDKNAYDIFVIADNCTDATAKVAREAGAIVYERTNDKLRGKGYALEWMFQKLFQMEKQYDNICIFDADNVVSANFLTEINKQHNKGFKVVQGNIDSKNPYDTWISCAYSISFWSIGRLYQLARYNLGLPCQLSGTGFSIATQVIKDLGWGATCLTEDMEFTAKLVLCGEKIGWAHEAVVFDEKPLTMKQSWVQRKRWMQGHADVASRFMVKLLKRSVKERSFSSFDCAIYLMQPLKVLALGVITLMAWIQTAYPSGDLGFFQMQYLFKNPFVWWFFTACDFLYIPFTISYERREFNWRLFVGYSTYWLYSLTWVPITIQGLIDKNKKEWAHTKHTRKIDIAEIEKAK